MAACLETGTTLNILLKKKTKNCQWTAKKKQTEDTIKKQGLQTIKSKY